MSRVLARISGMVQGVGYRYFIMRKATEYNIKGYVKNLYDGGVEVEAEGSEKNLKLLIKDLENGPDICKVDKIRSKWFDDEKNYKTFTLKW
jgi:acylphosphatase